MQCNVTGFDSAQVMEVTGMTPERSPTGMPTPYSTGSGAFAMNIQSEQGDAIRVLTS